MAALMQCVLAQTCDFSGFADGGHILQVLKEEALDNILHRMFLQRTSHDC